MRQQFIAALFTAFVAPAAADDVAPGGTLRAAYIGTNPAQATRDAATARHEVPPLISPSSSGSASGWEST